MKNISKDNKRNTSNFFKNKILDYGNFIFLLLALLILLRIVLIFTGSDYSWDLDHEMYFGNRLNYQELIYTFEYNDKLPIVQYLFFIPGALKNINIWVIFSLISSIITCSIIYNFTLNLIQTYRNNILDKKIIKKIILFSLLLYFFLICSIEGSLYHINIVALNFSVISNYIFFKNYRKKNLINYSFLLAAIFAAMSISIRPYLAIPILILPLWIEYRKINIYELISKLKKSNFKILIGKTSNIFFKNFIWIFFILFFGFIINAFPYLFSGNFNYFISGLFYISKRIHPWTPLNEIITQSKYLLKLEFLEAFLYVPFCISLIIILFVIISKRKSDFLRFYSDNYVLLNDILFFSLISPLFIQITIIYKHYFHHYNQFFIYCSVISIALYLFLGINFIHRRFKIKSNFNVIVLLLIIFLTSLTLKESFINTIYKFENFNQVHYLDSDLKAITEFLKKRKEKDLSDDFLHPYGMYIHWKLDESRKGFPHSANLGHINNNNIKEFKYGINKEELFSPKGVCNQIKKNGSSIIFISDDKPEVDCLKKNKDYYFDQKIKLNKKNDTLSVYIKNNLD